MNGKEQILVQVNPDVPPTGSDLGVVNAARKSFGRRSEWDCEAKLKGKDKRLLEFLARGMTADDFEEFKLKVGGQGLHWLYYMDNNKESELLESLWQWRNTPTHDTPFNHGFFSFEVKAPIFVARHLVKHEYLIMSEYSRRYITEDVEFYKHTYRLAAKDKKQGSGGAHPEDTHWSRKAHLANLDAVELYNSMIADGIAPEQARGQLPQDLMTAWTWSGTLGAFANMCKLRLSKDTQVETRYVAEQVYEHLKKQFPISAPLLVEGTR